MPDQTNRPIRILSVCDGIGALRHSLDLMGIPDHNIQYSRAEINEYSNQVFNTHYEAVNYGDLRSLSASDFTEETVPDLLVNSSPCTELSSISPNNHLQLQGQASSLFYEFIRLWTELKIKFPNHKIDVIVENVASMKSASRIAFSSALGFPATRINSKFDSACMRDRFYWCSFSLKDIYKYKIEKKTLKDILENGYADMKNDVGMCILSTDPCTGINGKGLRRSLYKAISTPIYVSEDYVGLSKEDKLELFHERVGISIHVPIDDEPVFRNGQYRFLSLLEKERALGFRDHYTDCGISDSQRKIMLGKTFNCNSIQRIMSCYPPIQQLLKIIPMNNKIEKKHRCIAQKKVKMYEDLLTEISSELQQFLNDPEYSTYRINNLIERIDGDQNG